MRTIQDRMMIWLRRSPAADRWALVPLRLVVGFGLVAHGTAKLARGPESFAAILSAIGVPAAGLTHQIGGAHAGAGRARGHARGRARRLATRSAAIAGAAELAGMLVVKLGGRACAGGAEIGS